MATALQFPAFPRHGILLNPSPVTSPYSHGLSLPGTPRLLSSVSSLSSSASSSSPQTSDTDAYFLTYASAKDTLSVPRGASSHTKEPSDASEKASKSRTVSVPQPRRIRFAPLPEPRRDDDDLSETFMDDDEDGFSALMSAHDPSSSNPPSAASSRPSSLLLSGVVNLDGASSDSTPTLSTTNLNGTTLANLPTLAVTSPPSADKGDYDWDSVAPISPATTLSSLDHCPGSCPESPSWRRAELPRDEKRTSWSSKLLRSFRPRASTSESNFFRSQSRESVDGMSSGASTPAGARSRSQSRERGGSVTHDFGAPLLRVTSENDGQKKRKSFLSSLAGSGSTEGGIWRTQSASGDLRRVESAEAEDLRRVRSGSGTARRPPTKMLNGRIYGAKRRRHKNVNLFANARDETEFVEWGYGGMGSVKSVASSGVDNKWSRVAGNASFGGASGEQGWGNRGRGRAAADDDDDGGGMAWVRKRREQKEREKKEAAEAAASASAKETAQEVAVVDEPSEQHDEPKPHVEVTDPDPPDATTAEVAPADSKAVVAPSEDKKEEDHKSLKSVAASTVKEPSEDDEEPEHVTTAVTIPAPRSPPIGNHRALTMERATSIGHVIRAVHPERKGSADTTATVTQLSISPLDSDPMVGEMDEEFTAEPAESRRKREGSEGSSGAGSSGEESDVEADDSPKESFGEDDEEEEEAQQSARLTARGAGVEKISRHKEKLSQDGVLLSS